MSKNWRFGSKILIRFNSSWVRHEISAKPKLRLRGEVARIIAEDDPAFIRATMGEKTAK